MNIVSNIMNLRLYCTARINVVDKINESAWNYILANVQENVNGTVRIHIKSNTSLNVWMLVRNNVWSNAHDTIRTKSLTHKQLQSAYTNLEKL